MITSRLTARARTTIPREIRQALRLEKGDRLGYVIEGERVILTVLPGPAGSGNAPSMFSEWDGEEDRRAYAGL